jgi:3-oxoacyl-[acyl-carrier-protein] synthase III
LRIVTVKHSVPERRVTNDAVIDAIRDRNQSQLSPSELTAVETKVRKHLALAGTEVRYLSDGRKPLEYVRDAGEQALSASQVSRSEIDFLIYAGIGRGWIEPATANAVQHLLGLSNATCFDILDACAGWLRALQVAHSFIRNGTYKRGLIVNCEVGLQRFADFDLSNPNDIDAKLAAFTIGEAATATMVSDESADDFYFRFKNFGQHYDLCMIPLDTADHFQSSGNGHQPASLKFFSQSRRLISTTLKEVIETYKSDPNLVGASYDICFGHTASEKARRLVGRRLGLAPEIQFPIQADYGNTASASLPLAMSLAIGEGRLKRGHRTLCIMGSAGITIGFAKFTF